MQETQEISKSEVHIIVEIIEYVPNSVLTRTIIKKNSGNVSVMSLDSGMELGEKLLPFDSFIQIIDGKAEIIIDGVTQFLNTGQGVVIPAHRLHTINASERFKMIITVIKSGYED
jgi:quercetin dioxygenase-like cupin family protein